MSINETCMSSIELSLYNVMIALGVKQQLGLRSGLIKLKS